MYIYIYVYKYDMQTSKHMQLRCPFHTFSKCVHIFISYVVAQGSVLDPMILYNTSTTQVNNQSTHMNRTRATYCDNILVICPDR